jgi:hypothetical protein
LFTLYDKDEMADLTPKQRAQLKGRVKGDDESVTLFDELIEGFDALADHRADKRTPRTQVMKARPAPKITARLAEI